MAKLPSLTAQLVVSLRLECGLVPVDDETPVSYGGNIGH